MKIALHVNHLDLRGTGVAVFDYAHHCEKTLGHEAFVVCPTVESQPLFQDERAAKRFESGFPVNRYGRLDELEGLLEDLEVDVFYVIKSGQRDAIVSKGRRTAIHAVFQHHEPHGDVYAYVSQWLSNKMSGGREPWVPHMVDLPDGFGDLRESLEIPPDAIVFGRYGSNDTFDIDFVHKAVAKIARRRPDIYFLFMNTDPFCAARPNIVHLPGTANPQSKVRFIDTCDAMLHGRRQGESFGLAVAEFSVRKKPILTFEGATDRAHIEQLGEKGLYYRTKRQLVRLLDGFEPNPSEEWDVYSRDFAPPVVMKRFERVFLS